MQPLIQVCSCAIMCMLVYGGRRLQGFYDRGKDLNWKNMKDIQFVAAMGPPGGARNAVDPRFVSLFDVFEIQFPSNENLKAIYSAILSKHAAGLSEEIRGGPPCRLCNLVLNPACKQPCCALLSGSPNLQCSDGWFWQTIDGSRSHHLCPALQAFPTPLQMCSWSCTPTLLTSCPPPPHASTTSSICAISPGSLRACFSPHQTTSRLLPRLSGSGAMRCSGYFMTGSSVQKTKRWVRPCCAPSIQSLQGCLAQQLHRHGLCVSVHSQRAACVLQLVQERVAALIQQKFQPAADHALQNPILFGDFKTFKQARGSTAAISQLSNITAACCMSVMHTGIDRHTAVPAAEVLRLQMSEPRLYQDLGTYEDIKPVVQEVLEEYNIKKKPMNLVFFDNALEHLTRIHRILRLRQVRMGYC